MAKYEITKDSIDNYTLKYKDQELKFKTDVELASELDSIPVRAEKRMIFDLAKEGVSKNSLSVKEQKGSKTYIDNSNEEALKNLYAGEILTELLDAVCEKMFGKNYTDLLLDIELSENEIEKFSVDFMSALTGKFPSQNK